MGLPKGFRKKVSFISQNEGPEKRQDYLDDIDYKGMYLPKSISYEDIDKNFFNFIENTLELNLNGEKIPVIVLSITKWAEFSKTWSFSDEYKNIKMPFITVVRQPDIQVGSNQAGNWNIPGNQLYTYLKIPNNEGGRKGVDTYKIPQPTSVDMTYDVKLFCNRMKDLNVFHTIVQKKFNSRQFYLTIKGHPIPIHLEKIGDESQKDDFNKRRFYVQAFEMKVLGYILDDKDFEVIPTINRAKLNFRELGAFYKNKKLIIYNTNVIKDDITYNFFFKPNSLLKFNYNSEVDVVFDTISNIENITNIIISVDTIEVHNGLIINTPITIKTGDVITIEITTNDINNNSLFNIIGKINID